MSEWLKKEQREQILNFLRVLDNSPHFEQYEEPFMELVNFSLILKHKYDADIMRLTCSLQKTTTNTEDTTLSQRI